MTRPTIDIQQKEPAFIRVLEDRKKLLNDVLDGCHDGGIVVDGTCELIVLEYLLDNRIATYDKTKEHLKKEIGYGNPLAAFEGGMGQAWQKPVFQKFDTIWGVYKNYAGYDTDRLKSELTW